MDGQQRIGPITELPHVLREMGHDPTRLIAGVGIDPDKFRDPEKSLTFVELGRLLQVCVTATGCEHFGLLVGQRSATSSLGLVGKLMRNAPTLKDALLDLCTNQKRYVRGAVAYFAVQDGTCFLGHAVHHQAMQSSDQLSDGAIAVGFNVISELVGTAPGEILLARRPPDNLVPYRQFYGSTPRFDAQQNALTFPASLLAHPVRGANPELRRILEKSVADYWALEQPSVVQTVTRLLRARIVFPNTSLETVASELSMHPRTLNRRLQAEGKSFRDLMSEARFQVARQLLDGTRMDVTDIALALGYAEPSSFTHAFQRWSDMAPSEWRRQDKP